MRKIGNAFRFAVVLLAIGFMKSITSAQQRDSATTQPPPVTVGGFVDSYFSYNFARPTTHTNQLRNFDVTENQFVVSTAEITVQKTPAPIGFRIDADFGPGNDIVQSGVTGSTSYLRQAYLTVVVPVGQGLSIDAGKFVTHCCYEVIPSKDNLNYSRSFLFAWSVPYYHVGARASYPVSSALGLNAYMYNGWNGAVPNSGKNFGFQANYSPAGSLSFTVNYLGGPTLPDSVNKTFRNVYELIMIYSATDRLTFAANGVYGQQELQSVSLWKGVAGYARYSLSDESSIAVRAEVFNDPEGYMTGTSQTLDEATLTYEYRPFSNLILRGEFRNDWSTASSFDGDTGPLTRKTQATLAIGAVVVF